MITFSVDFKRTTALVLLYIQSKQSIVNIQISDSLKLTNKQVVFFFISLDKNITSPLIRLQVTSKCKQCVTSQKYYLCTQFVQSFKLNEGRKHRLNSISYIFQQNLTKIITIVSLFVYIKTVMNIKLQKTIAQTFSHAHLPNKTKLIVPKNVTLVVVSKNVQINHGRHLKFCRLF